MSAEYFKSVDQNEHNQSHSKSNRRSNNLIIHPTTNTNTIAIVNQADNSDKEWLNLNEERNDVQSNDFPEKNEITSKNRNLSKADASPSSATSPTFQGSTPTTPTTSNNEFYRSINTQSHNNSTPFFLHTRQRIRPRSHSFTTANSDNSHNNSSSSNSPFVTEYAVEAAFGTPTSTSVSTTEEFIAHFSSSLSNLSKPFMVTTPRSRNSQQSSKNLHQHIPPFTNPNVVPFHSNSSAIELSPSVYPDGQNDFGSTDELANSNADTINEDDDTDSDNQVVSHFSFAAFVTFFFNKTISAIPIFRWSRKYNFNSAFLPDFICGLTLAVILVPQSLAYAVLANLPPVYGLYAALTPPMIYAIFGTCIQLHIGPFALISLLVADSVQSILDAKGVISPTSDDHIQTALTLSICMGVILLIMSFIRLGFTISFLADAVLSALNSASALLIFSSQLKSFTGVNIPRSSFINEVIYFFSHIDQLNGMTVMVGIISVLLLLSLDSISKRLKLRVALPSQLLVMGIWILISYLTNLHTIYDVDIVGSIPAGLPTLFLPSNDIFSNLSIYIQPAFITAFLSYIISMSLAKQYSSIHQIEIDSNQELFALGWSNLIGGFCRSYPSAASLSRTAVVNNIGPHTALHNIISSSIIIIILLFLTNILSPLPSPVLAAVIWVALKSLLIQSKEGLRLWRVKLSEFMMWFITFLSTLLFGVSIGIAMGISISLFTLIRQTARPPYAILGALTLPGPSEVVYRNLDRFPSAQLLPNIILYRFDGPLHFANKEWFRTTLLQQIKNRIQQDKLIIYQSTIKNRMNIDNIIDDEDEEDKDDVFSSVVSSDSSDFMYFVIIDMGSVIDVDDSSAKMLHTLIQDIKNVEQQSKEQYQTQKFNQSHISNKITHLQTSPFQDSLSSPTSSSPSLIGNEEKSHECIDSTIRPEIRITLLFCCCKGPVRDFLLRRCHFFDLNQLTPPFVTLKLAIQYANIRLQKQKQKQMRMKHHISTTTQEIEPQEEIKVIEEEQEETGNESPND